MKVCKNCLLPANVPGADLDTQGMCRFCRDYHETDHGVEEQARQARAADLEAALQASRGQGEYDCLLCFSGGKDSIYLLHKLTRDYNLKVLAFTTNINIPPIAWNNIHRAIDALDVDHIVYTPERDFYQRMFRFLLQNQEERGAVRTVCYVCAPLFEGYALKLAVEKGIPLVLGGYSPGQPDPERMLYEFPRLSITQVDWTPVELRESGLFSEAELKLFWNPHRYPAGTAFPRFLAPFHAWPYSQEENMKKVVELGLVAKSKYASPVHSNCPLNWLLMYSDLQNLGYNPYIPEFSALIRAGKASRLYWKVMMPVINFMIRNKISLGRNVKIHLKALDLQPEELVIRRSSRPEWPDFVRQDEHSRQHVSDSAASIPIQ